MPSSACGLQFRDKHMAGAVWPLCLISVRFCTEGRVLSKGTSAKKQMIYSSLLGRPVCCRCVQIC